MAVALDRVVARSWSWGSWRLHETDPGLVGIFATFLVLVTLGLLGRGLEAVLMWLL